MAGSSTHTPCQASGEAVCVLQWAVFAVFRGVEVLVGATAWADGSGPAGKLPGKPDPACGLRVCLGMCACVCVQVGLVHHHITFVATGPRFLRALAE